MKSYAFVLVTLICSTFKLSAQYSPPVFIDSFNLETVKQIAAADFNRDGFKDILVSSFRWPKDRLILYTYRPGIGMYGPSYVSGLDSFFKVEHFDTADINRDGYPDIALLYGVPSQLVWLENRIDSFVSHTIDSALDFSTMLLARDFDKDGILDIVSLQHTEIILNKGLSSGFDTARILHSGTEFYAIDAADFNKDGLMDVSVASGGFEILINDSNGGFNLKTGAGSAISFGLKSADTDLDGDNDILVFEALKGLILYANDGAANFSLRDTVLASTDNFLQFSFCRMLGDNYPHLYTSIPLKNEMVWVKNKNGNFEDNVRVIYKQAGELVAATAVFDEDGDGSDEIIWGNKHLAYHTIYYNPNVKYRYHIPLRINPNPAVNQIKIFNPGEEPVTISICDLQGRNIGRYEVTGNSEISAGEGLNGLYFVTVTDANGQTGQTYRIVFTGN